MQSAVPDNPLEGLPPVIGGKYRPRRPIAQGAMGTVYEVEHVSTGARLALKVLHGGVALNDAAVARFEREARVSALAQSDHVVHVLDAGISEELRGARYLVMELLDGEDLSAVARRGPANPHDIVNWLRDVAKALDAAHAAGIVHRDLKPENIFLARRADGKTAVKVLDFGVAKLREGDPSGAATISGTVVGTPLYMSPEQARADAAALGPWSDQWAIGMLAYRLLTGFPYWEDAAMPFLLVRIISERMIPPSEKGSPFGAAFDAWFSRSCDRDVTARFASVGAQVESLADSLAGAPTATMGSVVKSARPSVTPKRAGRIGEGAWWAAALAGVILAGLAFVSRTPREDRAAATAAEIGACAAGAKCGIGGRGTCNAEGYCLGPDMTVASRHGHTCARLEDGTVACWGDGFAGQNGSAEMGARAAAMRVRGLPSVTSLFVGNQHSCALTEGGDVWCWGQNRAGQLGGGAGPDDAVPRRVPGLAGVTSLALGAAHSCALDGSGAVHCWGFASEGQCGEPNEIVRVAPTRVDHLPPARLIAAGSYHTCAITTAGALYCWGRNDDGQLGKTDPKTFDARPSPVDLGGGRGAIAMGLGWRSSCAVRADQRVLCWGDNSRGQLGDGTRVSRVTPAPVVDEARAPIEAFDVIATAGRHVCATLAATQRYTCWGGDDNGELGRGAIPNPHGEFPMARQTVLPGEVRQLTLGEDHGCGVVVSERGGADIVCYGRGDRVANGALVRDADQLAPAPIRWAR